MSTGNVSSLLEATGIMSPADEDRKELRSTSNVSLLLGATGVMSIMGNATI